MLRIIFGFIAFVAGLVVSFASPVFFIKFLVDVLHDNHDFWYSVAINLGYCIIVEIVAYLVAMLAACIAVSLKE